MLEQVTVEFAYPPNPPPMISRLKLRALNCGAASVNWSSPGIQLGTTLTWVVGLAFCDCIGKHPLLLS